MREQEILLGLRKKIFVTGFKGGMAHLASCYSSLEMIYTLYMKDVLRYDKQNPKWEERDRFILSKGHAGMALYSVLVEAGLVSEEAFQSYLQEDSLIGGEPCMRDCPWVEATTGSLGHGLPMAIGIAMALKMDKNPAKVYVMLGDGECEEGTVWEAVMSAKAFGLDNLIVILDCNQIQKMDFVEKTIGMANWDEKWRAFGWSVDEVDGHDMETFKEVALKPAEEGTPRLIIAHTIKGKGVSTMENNANWHFRLPKGRELRIFKEELGVSDSELE